MMDYWKNRQFKKINKELATQFANKVQEISSRPEIVALVKLEETLATLKLKRSKKIKKLKKFKEKERLGNELYLCLHTDPYDNSLKERIDKLRLIKINAQNVLGIKNVNSYLKSLNAYGKAAIKRKGLLGVKDLAVAEDISTAIDEEDKQSKAVLRVAFYASVLGLTTSAAIKLYEAGDIYDVLRNVNGNYETYSDVEIWWDMLLLRVIDPNALGGMVNLTKGAYFEQLVADQTGGELFEAFNHPDTDIVIQGTEYQLKATDSVSYVEGVKDGIPVIATDEVADQTDAINSGISNDEITSATESALGGDAVDLIEAISTGAVSGLACVGVVPLYHAVNRMGEVLESREKKYRDSLEGNLENLLEASAEGALHGAEMFAESLPGIWNFLVSMFRIPLNIVHVIFDLIFIRILKINKL